MGRGRLQPDIGRIPRSSVYAWQTLFQRGIWRGQPYPLAAGCVRLLRGIAADYEKSRQFYVDILGFSIIRENHRPEKGDIKLDLKMNEEKEIELFIKSDAPERLTYPEAKGYRHLAIKTTNIEEDRNYLISQGVKVEEIRQDEITDRKMLFFYYSDDLPIELHE